MLEIIALACALAVCIWLPHETTKVLKGWVNKRFKGDQAAFLTAYRKQHTLLIWLGAGLAIMLIAVAVLEFTENEQTRGIVKLVSAAVWLAVTAVALRCRARLDAARAAGNIPPTAPA